jgi:lipoprotein-releasing system permease protein
MFVIALVVAAMIVVLSAFNGLEKLVSDLFGTLDSEIAVVPASGETIDEGLLNVVKEHDAVAYYSAIIESEAIISANGITEVCTVMGVDHNYDRVSQIERSVISGHWGRGDDCLILGMGIKSKLLLPSDSLMEHRVILRAPILGKKLSRHKERALKVDNALACGAFSINADLDTRYVISDIEFARSLFSRGPDISRIEMSLKRGYSETDLLKDAELLAALGNGAMLRTRAEKHKFITQTNRAEKWATFMILSFILVVAAFNVLASLTMLLIEKKEDLKVFRALGMQGRDIEMTFSIQGLAINVIGGFAGMILGVLLVWSQTQFGWIPLEGSVVPSYPMKFKILDLVGTLVVVIGVGGLGSAAMVRYLIRKIMV